MIFVSYGTEHFLFNRLTHSLNMIADQIEYSNELFVLQMGASNSSIFNNRKNVKAFDYCSIEQFRNYIMDSKIIITHAGVGSIFTILKLGRVPLVIPRLKCFGEQVDDHQIQITKKFSESKYIIELTDVGNLPYYLNKYDNLIKNIMRYTPSECTIGDYINSKYLI